MSEKYYKRTPNGQVAAVGFDKQNVVPYLNQEGVETTPEIRDYLNRGGIKVLNTEATVADSMNAARRWVANPDIPNTGTYTGTSPSGIRNIISTVKQKAAALPPNELLGIQGATPELHDTYTRLLQKSMPDTYVQGTEGGNYLTSPQMHATWRNWLSKILPSITEPMQINSAADLYDNVKKQGPMAGYANWVGLQTTDPTKDEI